MATLLVLTAQAHKSFTVTVSGRRREMGTHNSTTPDSNDAMIQYPFASSLDHCSLRVVVGESTCQNSWVRDRVDNGTVYNGVETLDRPTTRCAGRVQDGEHDPRTFSHNT